jgi:two-component system sensor histidine kinase PilS (NtrC family)
MVLIVAFITGFIAAGIALYFILRALFITRKRLTEGTPAKDPSVKKEKVEFVIDTFSTLINKLKEKEGALERLRKQAETRASVAESYNEDILRCVGSGVISFNMDRVITTFNDAAERILKRNRDEVLGLSCADAFGPDNTLCRLLYDFLISGKPISRQEVELQKKTGLSIWVGLSISPLKDKEGKQIGIILVFTDLTEIKMLREQSELKKRLAMLGEMSGGIAHEFRNSMGTIMGYVKILSKRLKEDDQAQEVMSTVISEINSMDLIIKELLNYGKPVTLSLAPVDLNGLIKKALDTTLGRYPDIKIDVDLRGRIPADLPQFYLDEVLMRQALQNIIQNAVESMPAGGNLKIEIKSQLLNPPSPPFPIEIFISDTGSGMPQEVLENIFLPFYTTKPRGTGMGLALVHKIILAHGGGIHVESQEGQGTTFRVYIPWLQS